MRIIFKNILEIHLRKVHSYELSTLCMFFEAAKLGFAYTHNREQKNTQKQQRFVNMYVYTNHKRPYVHNCVQRSHQKTPRKCHCVVHPQFILYIRDAL